jgi:type I restriction enzyme S subunit
MTKTVLLSDITEFLARGAAPKYTDTEGFYVLNQKCIRDWRVSLEQARFTDFIAKKVNEDRILIPNDILINSTGQGTLGRVGQFYGSAMPATVDSHITIVRANPDLVDPLFLGYALKGREKEIEELAEGSTGQTELSRLKLANLKVMLPDINQQKKIAYILRLIDEKIELSRKMNETLEQMGQTLFRHYFIDNPEAEKWEDGVLGDIIVNFDSKRKPLSSRQRAEMQGEYRYFGATSVMDYVNDYLFDGTYLLLAEDGSVIKSDGTPYLQYVWGKFWVNNHTHILQTKTPFTVEYLYLLLSLANVQSLISGAVQLKINQKAMNSFKIKLPPNELVKYFCEKIDPMFAQRRKNEEQVQTLTTLRDTLLSRLITGKVKIDGAG